MLALQQFLQQGGVCVARRRNDDVSAERDWFALGRLSGRHRYHAQMDASMKAAEAFGVSQAVFSLLNAP